MTQTLYPCIWCDGTAAEAADFYVDVFPESRITSQNPAVVMTELTGQPFMLLIGGPQFQPNPSISFFRTCETAADVDALWERLVEGGTVMMPLDSYDWSPRYGWVQDRYGVSWQVLQGSLADMGQITTPALMFVGEQNGRAEQAIELYASIFEGSAVHSIRRYEDGDEAQAGNVLHAQFELSGQRFIAMDGGQTHDFSFSEGVSLVVPCDTQAEIDHYWNALTRNGEESMCGWLKDPFGVSWQIVPTVLGELMSDPDRAQRVMEAFLQMKKFDIEGLMKA